MITDAQNELAITQLRIAVELYNELITLPCNAQNQIRYIEDKLRNIGHILPRNRIVLSARLRALIFLGERKAAKILIEKETKFLLSGSLAEIDIQHTVANCLCDLGYFNESLKVAEKWISKKKFGYNRSLIALAENCAFMLGDITIASRMVEILTPVRKSNALDFLEILGSQNLESGVRELLDRSLNLIRRYIREYGTGFEPHFLKLSGDMEVNVWIYIKGDKEKLSEIERSFDSELEEIHTEIGIERANAAPSIVVLFLSHELRRPSLSGIVAK